MVPSPRPWQPVAPTPSGLVRPVSRDPIGRAGPSRGAARGLRWRRTSQGYYVPASVDGSSPEQRTLEQSVRLPDGGAVTGWAACRLWGAAFFDGLARDGHAPLPVPLATGGRRVRGDHLVHVMRDRLDPDEVVVRFGIPCVRAERALFDAMRVSLDVREAVVAMDMMAAAERTSVHRMRRYVQSRAGWRGLPVVRRALDLSDEQSRSPSETRARMVWRLDARLPPPMVNRQVFDRRGRLLAVADLLDGEAGLVGEYDGADHRSAARHSADVRREDLLRRHGLELFRVTAPDLAHTVRLVRRMHEARNRARWEPERSRLWTIEPPTWWAPAPSLDEVLDVRDTMRALHEASSSRSAPS